TCSVARATSTPTSTTYWPSARRRCGSSSAFATTRWRSDSRAKESTSCRTVASSWSSARSVGERAAAHGVLAHDEPSVWQVELPPSWCQLAKRLGEWSHAARRDKHADVVVRAKDGIPAADGAEGGPRIGVEREDVVRDVERRDGAVDRLDAHAGVRTRCAVGGDHPRHQVCPERIAARTA